MDPSMPPPSAAAGPPRGPVQGPRKGKRTIIVGASLLGLSVVMFVLGIVGIARSSIVDTFTADEFAVPGTFRQTLETGEHSVFVTGIFSANVEITGPEGRVRTRPSFSDVEVTRGNRAYQEAVQFDVDTPGLHTIVVDDVRGSAFVAPSLEEGLSDAVGAILLIVGSVVIGIAGLIVLIVGLVQRSRSNKQASTQGFGVAPGAPPPSPNQYTPTAPTASSLPPSPSPQQPPSPLPPPAPAVPPQSHPPQSHPGPQDAPIPPPQAPPQQPPPPTPGGPLSGETLSGEALSGGPLSGETLSGETPSAPGSAAPRPPVDPLAPPDSVNRPAPPHQPPGFPPVDPDGPVSNA